MSPSPADLKARLLPLRKALYDFEAAAVQQALQDLLAPQASVQLGHPYPEMSGPEAFYAHAWAPLAAAWPDLERRETIVLAGTTEAGDNWVGCCGFYTGTFQAPWWDIPPTGHQVAMRFHEFYRILNGQVHEVQALWDLPEVMLQAQAWPLAPSLGREWQVPGPATQDGLCLEATPEASATSRQTVLDMLTAMVRHPAEGGPEVMELERFWHPRMSWYGPAGIGTGRGIAGFRRWHQIPFLKAMPDRGQHADGLVSHFFAEGPYVAVTGWPNMRQTLTDDGWLGIAPAGQPLTLRSLDFWRLEAGKIRENWVLVDLMDVYQQLGVDVLARMRDYTAPRQRPVSSFQV